MKEMTETDRDRGHEVWLGEREVVAGAWAEENATLSADLLWVLIYDRQTGAHRVESVPYYDLPDALALSWPYLVQASNDMLREARRMCRPKAQMLRRR